MEKVGVPVVAVAVVLVVMTVGYGVPVVTGVVVPVVAMVVCGVPTVVIPVAVNDVVVGGGLVVMIPVIGEGVTKGVG